MTGAAAAALDGAGKFPRAGRIPRDAGEIDEARAVAIAHAYLRTYGGYLRDALSAMRGLPVNERTLVPCGGALYGATPYAAPGPDIPAALRRVVGSKWLVEFCDAGTPAVSIAVSALATHLSINKRGLLDGETVNAFFPVGIAAGARARPVTAEDAVDAVFRATGRRVVEVPELVLPALPDAPQLARWRVILDGPATLRATRGGATLSRPDLYAGFGTTWRYTGLFAGAVSDKRVALPAATPRTGGGATAVSATTFTPEFLPGYAGGVERVEVTP